MKKSLITLFLIVFIAGAFAQSPLVKREFRGAWIATVLNIDWPVFGSSTEKQKQDLINLLDNLKAAGINAVLFQVRTECDALYNSPYEPWSYHLTGAQGKAPSPYYDPLEFAIEEAHKRGMELHAWFNPYRAERTVGAYTLASNHPASKKPEWTLVAKTLRILNPGMAEVRQYITNVVLDVVNRYNLDGVHFDDYFYPYPEYGFTNQDATTFANEPRGFANVGDWRRDNVNLLIKMVHDSIQAVKPYVKFGMSPFGIWKNGVPSGITGMDAYSSIYCDGLAWLRNKSVDYMTPQLYWRIGGNQDYSKLSSWWADSTTKYDAHFYPGQAAYVMNTTYGASEIHNQIRMNRANPKTKGQVFYNASSIPGNYKGMTDSLKKDLYRKPALTPAMTMRESIAPNKPVNVIFDRVPGKGYAALQWEQPTPASDGDVPNLYVVYASSAPITSSTITDPNNILDIQNRRPVTFKSLGLGATVNLAVTALDRNSNESDYTAGVTVSAPAVPQLAYPNNGIDTIGSASQIKWNYAAGASFYQLQISTAQDFSTGVVVNNSTLQDTAFSVTALEGEVTYYWRVKSLNLAGESNYSDARSFKTGFPKTPVQLYPVAASNVPLDTLMRWEANPLATEYRIQIAKSNTFDPLVLDTVVTGINTLKLRNLDFFTLYFWRVQASNSRGTSKWTVDSRFRTVQATDNEDFNSLPKEYTLYQNYPNPFNPSTTIRFALPKQETVHLKVYDLFGREVVTLIQGDMTAGFHSVEWNGRNSANQPVASGVYVYRLVAGDFTSEHKMNLIK